MVAGAVAALQSVSKSWLGEQLPPSWMRQLLIDTGTLQGTRYPGHIGPLPNLARAIHWLGVGTDSNGDSIPDECAPPPEFIDINRNAIADECEPVLAVGCRYISITPGLISDLGTGPVALRVIGNSVNVSCISQYVQQPDANSRAILGPAPHYRTPVNWETVIVSDEKIVPTTSLISPTKYRVNAVPQCTGICVPGPGVLIGTEPATMWLWGDTDKDDDADTDDFACVSQATQGIFTYCSGFESADLMACEPERDINVLDVEVAILQGTHDFYSVCSAPCP